MKEVLMMLLPDCPLLPPGGGDAVPTDGARAPATGVHPSGGRVSLSRSLQTPPGLFLCAHLLCGGEKLMEGAYPVQGSGVLEAALEGEEA